MIINIKGCQLAGKVDARRNDTAWGGRASMAVTVPMAYQTALALFEDDTPWSVTQETAAALDPDTGEVTEVGAITTDMSEYAISGPITDNRDGTVTIRMGKYSPDELMQATLAAVPGSHAQARTWRGIIEEAVQHIEDDTVALAAAPLYPAWDKLAAAGAAATVGMRVQHEGKLYRVLSPHTFTAEYHPGNGTESLYTRIDEAHAGTEADPIPYDGNMALVEGLYYAQGGVAYRCTRDTGSPVYHALADLVGLYVEVVG